MSEIYGVCGQPRPAVVRRKGREVARSGGLPAVFTGGEVLAGV